MSVKCFVNLSLAPQARPLIASTGMVPFLLGVLKTLNKSSAALEFRKWILWIFTNLAIDQAVASAHFNNPHALAIIVELSKQAGEAEGDADARTRGLAVLRNLSKHAALIEALVSTGAIHFITPVPHSQQYKTPIGKYSTPFALQACTRSPQAFSNPPHSQASTTPSRYPRAPSSSSSALPPPPHPPPRPDSPRIAHAKPFWRLVRLQRWRECGGSAGSRTWPRWLRS